MHTNFKIKTELRIEDQIIPRFDTFMFSSGKNYLKFVCFIKIVVDVRRFR